MTYTWRNTTQNGVSSTIELSAHAVLSLRITVTAVLAFGVVCIGALVITLSLQFGDHLDQNSVLRAFDKRDARSPKLEEYRHESEQPRTSPSVSFPVTTFHSCDPLPLTSAGIPHMPFPTTKLMDANSILPLSLWLPRYIQYQNQCFSPWDPFVNELQNVIHQVTLIPSLLISLTCYPRFSNIHLHRVQRMSLLHALSVGTCKFSGQIIWKQSCAWNFLSNLKCRMRVYIPCILWTLRRPVLIGSRDLSTSSDHCRPRCGRSALLKLYHLRCRAEEDIQ